MIFDIYKKPNVGNYFLIHDITTKNILSILLHLQFSCVMFRFCVDELLFKLYRTDWQTMGFRLQSGGMIDDWERVFGFSRTRRDYVLIVLAQLCFYISYIRMSCGRARALISSKWSDCVLCVCHSRDLSYSLMIC